MGYIYKITNRLNGAVYIGMTTRDYKVRWNEHLNFLGQSYDRQKDCLIHRALNKYGKENFLFEVIEETNNLDERERYWIKYYSSYIKDPNYQKGYNMTPGGRGESFSIFEKSILSLWNEGKSIQEILKGLNCSYATIINILNKANISHKDRVERSYKDKSRPVHQYTLDGIFVQKFPSLGAVIREYPNLTSGNLSSACKGKNSQAGRFLWIYAEEDNENLLQQRVQEAKNKTHHRNHAVNQYTLNGEYLKTYSTIKEACDSLGLKSTSSIINVCKGRAKTAGGYKWKYKD